MTVDVREITLQLVHDEITLHLQSKLENNSIWNEYVVDMIEVER